MTGKVSIACETLRSEGKRTLRQVSYTSILPHLQKDQYEILVVGLAPSSRASNFSPFPPSTRTRRILDSIFSNFGKIRFDFVNLYSRPVTAFPTQIQKERDLQGFHVSQLYRYGFGIILGTTTEQTIDQHFGDLDTDWLVIEHPAKIHNKDLAKYKLETIQAMRHLLVIAAGQNISELATDIWMVDYDETDIFTRWVESNP